MGSNVYLKGVDAVGYKTATAATAIIHYIQPKSGSRLAVRAFGCTAGGTATTLYFMQTLGSSTLSAAVASGATTGFALAGEPVSSNALVSSDYVGITVDDGTVHFTTVATGLYTGFSIAAALDDTAAAGNTVYFFGVAADTGHYRVSLTASVETSRNLDGGVCYAPAKGYPMIVYHANDAAAAGSIGYVTFDALNV